MELNFWEKVIENALSETDNTAVLQDFWKFFCYSCLDRKVTTWYHQQGLQILDVLQRDGPSPFPSAFPLIFANSH